MKSPDDEKEDVDEILSEDKQKGVDLKTAKVRVFYKDREIK